jgi:hypothetical protein
MSLLLFRAFFGGDLQVGQVENVFVLVSAHDESREDFIAFLTWQRKRLKFKLVVVSTPLRPDEIERFGTHGLETGVLEAVGLAIAVRPPSLLGFLVAGLFAPSANLAGRAGASTGSPPLFGE